MRTTIILILFGVVVFAAIALSTLLLAAGGRELVLNGGFEDGPFVHTQDEPFGCPLGSDAKTNCKELCGGSTTVARWRVISPSVGGTQNCASAKDAVTWVTDPNPFGVGARPKGNPGDPDNIRFLDLTGFASRPPAQYGAIQQDVMGLEKDATYELSFYVGTSNTFLPVPKPPAPGGFYRITVAAPGIPDGQTSFDVPAATGLSQWDQKKIQFKAVNPTTTITFSAFGSADPSPPNHGGDYLGIDDVSLRKMCWIVRAVLFGCP